jgi:AraC family transcriptional activator of pobA
VTITPSHNARDTAELPIADFSIAPLRRIVGMSADTIDNCALPEPGWAHRHTYYMVSYITSGTGTHVIDCCSYPLRAETLYFLRPDQVHAWEYGSLPSGYVLAFSEDFLRAQANRDGLARYAEIFNDLADVAALQLSSAQARSFRPIIEELVREYRESATDHSSIMQAYLQVLLARAHRLLPANAAHQARAGGSGPLVRRFTDLVAHSGGAHHTVRDYSGRLGVTPSHLAETVKEVTGRTPGQIIRQAQIVEAKRLLRHTEQNMAQIAYELGFKDTAYFGRFFKRETGITPGEFRRHARTTAPVPLAGGAPDAPRIARAG